MNTEHMSQERLDNLRAQASIVSPLTLTGSKLWHVISDLLNEVQMLIAERDAEKKRADALAPAIEYMKQALCCGGFGELSAACSELWRIWDQNDPACAENAQEGSV